MDAEKEEINNKNKIGIIKQFDIKFIYFSSHSPFDEYFNVARWFVYNLIRAKK